MNPDEIIHIAVHVQKGFFNPPAPRPSEERRQPDVDRTVRRIAEMASAFDAAGISTFWIRLNNEDMSEDSHELYGVKPGRNDAVLEDYERPTVLTDETLALLRERNIKSLLISGGYASLCVTDLVQDALSKGFDIHVMKDCLIDNQDEMDLTGMFSRSTAKNRAVFETSDDIREMLDLKPLPQKDRERRIENASVPGHQ